jgi:hypothetical protein
LGRNSRKINKKQKKFDYCTDTGATSEPEEVMMIEETWMQPYLAYMVNKK